MLTEAKNQFKITLLSIKYGLIKEMDNKATFITNILFMILNNSCFIFEWLILFNLKDNFGGYGIKEVLLLWGFAASTYGFSHFGFESVFDLSTTINTGKIDAFLVQPKSVLLSSITTKVSASAIGDMIYGYIMLFVYGFTIKRFLLFTLFTITGGIIIVAFAVILGSLSFYIKKSSNIADIGNSLITNFQTYPDGIFKGIAKVLLFTIIPVAFTSYIPLKMIIDFKLYNLGIILAVTLLITGIAIIMFNKGLKRYSSGNLMIANI